MIDVAHGLFLGTARSATPILLAACGSYVYARAGVTCLAVEGFVTAGALIAGALLQTHVSPLIALAAVAVVGGLLGYAHEWLVRWASGEYVLVGVSLVLAFSGGAAVFGRSFEGLPLDVTAGVAYSTRFGGELADMISYITLAIAIATVWLVKYTSIGIDIRASAGELHPDLEWYERARRTRGLAAVAAGASAAAAGFLLIVYAGQWTPGIVGGRGWLAVLATIIAARHGLRILFVTYLFGLLTRTDLLIQSSAFASAWIGGPNRYFVAMFPYVVCLVVLAWRGWQQRAPRLTGTQ